MTSINGEFKACAAKHELFVARPNGKAPACASNEFHELDNSDWQERIKSGSNLGLKLALYTQSETKLMCFEADSEEADENLEDFINRHQVEALVFKSPHGYKHYVTLHDKRLEGIRSYLGFEVKQDWVLIPPSLTNTGQRKWRGDAEERFISGNIPGIVNSAVEEMLRSRKTKLRAPKSKSKIYPRLDWRTDWLNEFNYSRGENEGEWIRPGSHTGARSLVVNHPEPGWMAVYSSSIDGIVQGKYPIQDAYARITGKTLAEAHEYFGLEEYRGDIVAVVEWYANRDFKCIVRNLRAVKRDGSARSYPGFDVELHYRDEMQGSTIACSTAKKNWEHLLNSIADLLDFDTEEATDFADAITDEVIERVKVAVEEAEETADDIVPKGFTLEVQQKVVDLMRSEIELTSWRNTILMHPPNKYWYKCVPDEDMEPIVRKYAKRVKLPTCRSKHVEEVLNQVKAETRVQGMKTYPPYNRSTGQTDEYLIAYDDKPVRIQCTPCTDSEDSVITEEVIDSSAVVVLDALPYTQQQIAEADTTATEQLLQDWFPNNLGAQNARRMFKQLMGLVISNLRPQAVFWISGPPGTAKSKATDLLSLLLPHTRVKIKTTWRSMDSQFASDGLERASLLVCQELGKNPSREALVWLKAITGERRVEVDAKKIRQFEIDVYCTVVCSSNQHFPTTDAALVSRMKHIPMLRTFRGTADDKDDFVRNNFVRDGVLDAGVYRVALEGLKDYVQYGISDTDGDVFMSRFYCIYQIIDDTHERTGREEDRIPISDIVVAVQEKGMVINQAEVRECLEEMGLQVVSHSNKLYLLGFKKREAEDF